MISQDVMDIQEFRRFISQNIYPEAFGTLIDSISIYFQTNDVSFESQSKPLIKFKMDHSKYNQSELTDMIHKGFYTIFMRYFNDKNIVKMCRNKAYEGGLSIDYRCKIADTLTKIQLGDCNIISLLYNITILNNVVYLYL